MTKFVDTKVRLSSGFELIVDGNSKISGWDPRPNAFSLPAPATCPGSTVACRSTCYASSDGSKLPEQLRDRYDANLETLKAIFLEPNAGYDQAVQFGRWIAEHCQDTGFRWHVSGDVFSDQHAWWIVVAVLVSPEVQHWIYTRTLRVVPILSQASPGLALSVSADRDNFRQAAAVAREYHARLTYLWSGEEIPELPSKTVIFPDYSARAQQPPPRDPRLCKADLYGHAETRRCGVCTRCGNPRHR